MESNTALALRIVHNAELRHPDLPLMESFLYDAVDVDQAARYLLQTCANDTDGTKLNKFVEDWMALVKRFYVENPRPGHLDNTIKRLIAQRDRYRCCLTRTRGRFWNAWGVFPIIPLTAFYIQEQRLYDMLGAFITPSQRDRLFSVEAETQTPKTLIRNHWALSKEAAEAFSRGEIRLEKSGATKHDIQYNDIGGKPPAICTTKRLARWRCNLADRSGSNIESPDPDLLEIHCRFSRALKWTSVAANMKRNPRAIRKTTNARLTDAITTGLLAVWLKFPDMIRLQAYKLLRAVGPYLYDESCAFGVQRLPFGMYLKYGPENHLQRHARELNALRLVRSRTSIPVPRPIDLILSPTSSFLVTSRIERDMAGLSIDECSDQEMSVMAQDLRKYIAELHAIEMPANSSHYIASASGGTCLDYRIDSMPVGPFHDEKEFSESLRLGILPDLVHRDDHKIVFTHCDLNLRNILVKDGRISGIVDWENAGWFPEYWEYTKCHFFMDYADRWLRMVETVFGSRYGEELKIERQYWGYHSAW